MTLHVTVLQVVYGAVYLDWKLQNNHEKRSISRTKQFYRNLLVGVLEELAKNTQVRIICHNIINLKTSQETDRQTDRQSTVTLVRVRRALTRVDTSACTYAMRIHSLVSYSHVSIVKCTQVGSGRQGISFS